MESVLTTLKFIGKNMKKFKLDEMTKGWFVGDFEPVAIKTKDCEVGVKYYMAGTKEIAHYHSKAEELTVIISGKVRMNDDVRSFLVDQPLP